MPPELTERSQRGIAAFEKWVEMHQAGDELATRERQHGVTSAEAIRVRVRARRAREELLHILGLDADELQAQYSLRSERGRHALALGRY